jgi:hypothetical protein
MNSYLLRFADDSKVCRNLAAGEVELGLPYTVRVRKWSSNVCVPTGQTLVWHSDGVVLQFVDLVEFLSFIHISSYLRRSCHVLVYPYQFFCLIKHSFCCKADNSLILLVLLPFYFLFFLLLHWHCIPAWDLNLFFSCVSVIFLRGRVNSPHAQPPLWKTRYPI